MEQDHTRPYARDSHPTREELLFSEVEDFFGGAGPTELPIDTFAGSDIDLRKSGGDATEEYPWQIFNDGGVWKVRHGVFAYRGNPDAPVDGMLSGGDFEITIVAAGAGLTEYIALYLRVDLSASTSPAGNMLQAQDGAGGRFPTVPSDTNRYEHLAIGWLEVDENEDVVDHGQFFTGGVVIFTGGG